MIDDMISTNDHMFYIHFNLKKKSYLGAADRTYNIGDPQLIKCVDGVLDRYANF